ncbi:MAG: tRNA-dihydrouridine synthase family protein, partial [Brevinematales bacterium]
EMVSLEGLHRGNKRTWNYLDLEGEPCTTVQLFGKNEPAKFYEVSRLLQQRIGIKIIDVNFGCPVRKVIRTGSGSFLLNHPGYMSDIVKALKDSGVTVSVKIRSGFDKDNLEETIPALDKAGADIIIVHPRLAIQFYNGSADWDKILKARLLTGRILAASGDIMTPEDAEKVLTLTKADAVMIGRRAVGSPYIFKQIIEYFSTGAYTSYSLPEIKVIMLAFARLFTGLIKKDDIVPIRSTLIQYVRNYQNSKDVRHGLSMITTMRELEEVIKTW